MASYGASWWRYPPIETSRTWRTSSRNEAPDSTFSRSGSRLMKSPIMPDSSVRLRTLTGAPRTMSSSPERRCSVSARPASSTMNGVASSLRANSRTARATGRAMAKEWCAPRNSGNSGRGWSVASTGAVGASRRCSAQ